MSYTERILHLPKEKWQGTVLPIGYTANEYYEVEAGRTADGFSLLFRKREAVPPITHSPEEYNFPDKLYEPWWDGACAWGVTDGDRLIAAIETCPETWSNRLRVTELWVDAPYRRQGLGRALMAIAREQARLERRRAVILETQSCNAGAIGFYLHEGFTLIGCDTCAYSNRDMERREVRMELGWFPRRPEKVSRRDVEIRAERPEDYHAVEQMIRRAFWNQYRRGCDEHYLLHKMRGDAAYLPQLSRIAVMDGEIVGGFLYPFISWRGRTAPGGADVRPSWRRTRMAGMRHWRDADAGDDGSCQRGGISGYRHIWQSRVLFACRIPRLRGFRYYYARWEKSSCFHGDRAYSWCNAGISGVFREAALFETLSPSDVDAFDRNFPPMKKQYFPAQWPSEEKTTE